RANHDYAALDWVKIEIESTLQQAQKALQAYTEHPDDTTRMRFCLTYLHQVHGTLKMVEFYGASLLADAMEKLAQGILKEELDDPLHAQEILVRATFQLPAYLEQVLLNRRDMPLIILPLINELRAALGASPLTESALNISSITSCNEAFFNLPEAPAVKLENCSSRQLRQVYQTAFTNLIRHQDIPAQLEKMSIVVASMRNLAENTPSAQFWWLISAFIEGLIEQSIELDMDCQRILSSIDRHLKDVVATDEALQAEASEGEIKNILSHIIKSDSISPHIAAVKAAYKIEETTQSKEQLEQLQQQLNGPDSHTLSTVTESLSDELSHVKETLDLFLHGNRPPELLTGILPNIKQIADTLSILSMHTQRDVLLGQLDTLNWCAANSTSADTENRLLDVAGAVLYVEATLSSIRHHEGTEQSLRLSSTASSEQLNDAQASLIIECRKGMETSKSHIIEFIASNWDHAHLQDVPTILKEVSSGLHMVPLHRASLLVYACESYIEENLLNKSTRPDQKDMDTLADAIASIEHFLELITNDRHTDEYILDITETSMNALGYPIEKISLPINNESTEKTSSAPSSAEISDAIDDSVPALHKVSDTEAETQPIETAEEAIEPELKNNSGNTDTPPSSNKTNTDTNDFIDDEIIEIFVEEAQEVVESIVAHLPVWRSDWDNKDSLGEIRRAFHTLKGSGRLVGATEIGELAWSIENILNRLIENSIAASEAIFKLIDQVIALTPSLIFSFERQQPPETDTSHLIAQAELLSSGKTPEQAVALDDSNTEFSSSEMGSEATVEEQQKEIPLSSSHSPEFKETLLNIFINEALSHLSTLHQFLDKHPLDQAPVKVDNDVLRALHTLKGSAHMAEVNAVASIISPVEALIKNTSNFDFILESELLQLLSEAVHTVDNKLELISRGEQDLADLPDDALFVKILNLEEKYRNQDNAKHAKASKESLIEIFLAEEMDVILEAADLLYAWEQNPGETKYAEHLCENIQLIAVNAETSGLQHIQLLCDALSSSYQKAQSNHVEINKVFFEATHAAHTALIDMMDKLAARQPVSSVHDIINTLEHLPISSTNTTEEETLLGQLNNDENKEQKAASISDMISMDPELVAIFIEEAEVLLIDLTEQLLHWAEHPDELSKIDPLLRTLHTLKGSARMAKIKPIGNIAHELESLYERCRHSGLTFSTPLYELFQEADDSLNGMLHAVQKHNTCAESPLLIQKLKTFSQEIEQTNSIGLKTPQTEKSTEEIQAIYTLDLDPELVEIFLEEAEDILAELSGNLLRWAENPDDSAEIEQLQRSLHTLKGSSRMAEIPAIGDLAHELETLYEFSTAGELPYSEALADILNQSHDALADMVEAVKSQQPCISADLLIQQLISFGQTHVKSDLTVSPSAMLSTSAEDKPDIRTEKVLTLDTEADENDEAFVVDTSDIEVIQFFLEEAQELLEGIESSIEDWQGEPENTEPQDEMKRLLHTMKGSSRLAGLDQLGTMSHAFESFIINLKGDLSNDTDALFNQIKSKYDQMAVWVEKLNSKIVAQSTVTETSPNTPEMDAEAELIRQANAQQSPPMTVSNKPADTSSAAPQEMIRVSADLLEELVNLAGETSISRAQVEKEIVDFSHTLDDIGDTIERLQEQMRRLNIETEAQIIFSHESEAQAANDTEEGYEDFDPLEMDRYSHIHQLSRSLSESTGDLLDLKNTLKNRSRDTETLLLQQSRINTELQEGLMRTRLVPFSRLAPRLRRTVRQIGQELGKSVELEIINAEGEMDRAVLDRMVSPLEHMLRNAVDHGIESPEQREKSDKPKKGKITLHLTREGAEVVLRLSDDGAGINAENVRNKALERKLIAADNDSLSNTEILQFIFQPGFSTAEKVTQISGRGVGMDVVNSEIRQLGGSTRIHSAPGVGTQFTVRLPFTVSVNRALMVRVGEDTYAIPLSHIEGIIRVSPYELESYYQPGNDDTFEYAGQDYHLTYLGAYVKNIPVPILQGQTQALPVILIRGTDKTMAFQVDALIGSSEIVVKSLGPQLSSVTGLSGATILGDGNVVIILDLITMIRSDWAERLFAHIDSEQTAQESIDENKTPTVMVIDDSVTVRKITSRLLERNGYEVILAKDGMDAIAILQDHTPDVMLLDIEMPRMDGFEVASIVRHEDRLKHIPIIMITSRTGQKHRERALSIGVNEYLGKPFQEAELLANVEKLTGATQSA
ncbi:MAG: Hpt domain-containing protein, partial [Gammaproteobacteria bacterium]|nr:Hpt domain-containing protein [Gammaproteobacteria bacterium]